MPYIRTTGGVVLTLLILGCGSRSKDTGGAPGGGGKGFPAPAGKIEGNAKDLIVGLWDAIPPPGDTSFDRDEYTKDGKYRFWFLKRTPQGLKDLEDKEPGDPVNEGPYKFLDDRTFQLTVTNGTVTSKHKYMIDTLTKDTMILVTEEGKSIVHKRVK